MRRSGLAVAVLLMLAATTAAADDQVKTDFSGKWLAIPRSIGGDVPGLGTGAFECGAQCTIEQTVSTLTIKRPPNRQGVALPDTVLNLDGRPSKITQLARGGTSQQFEAVAKWNGVQLIITRNFISDGQAYTITQTVSTQDGNLIVATDYGRKGVVVEPRTYKKGSP